MILVQVTEEASEAALIGHCSVLAGDSCLAAASPARLTAGLPRRLYVCWNDFLAQLLNFSISGIRGRCVRVREEQVWRVAIEGC